jgi:para-aminobenzoate synthetase/4-amino-4-deoxychorismate lyase
VISELEATARHAYTGAVGYASPVAGLELDVVIRTFEVRDGVAWLGAGGGIVADSDPDAEVREALDKARPLVAALGAELRPGPLRGARLPAARALTGGLERPDPALGLFETIAVRQGVPIDLDAHLARLRRSVETLFGETLPEGLAPRVREASRGRDARLRIDLVPAAHGVDAGLTLRDAGPPAAAPARVVAVTLPGGLGEHKWRDRRLVEALEARHGGLPLFVDADGSVLEASMANVWVVEGDALVTPPADGRILPGVTRARALALPGAREEPIDLDRLEGADAVLLTSSIALVRTVEGREPDDALVVWLRRVLADDRAL